MAAMAAMADSLAAALAVTAAPGAMAITVGMVVLVVMLLPSPAMGALVERGLKLGVMAAMGEKV
jgi:hypothetical protein